MMSAPAARTSSWCTPLIAPWVPTGMKAGVRTTPWAVVISPTRAAASVAISRNEKGRAMAVYLMAVYLMAVYLMAVYLSEQQASVAIRVEAIIVRDRMVVSAAHHLEPAEGADQHEECRTRQVKIGQECIDGAKTITGYDEQCRLAGKRQRAVGGCGAFKKPQ